MTGDRLAIATIARPHGVRGEVKVRCSPDYLAFLAGCPLVHVAGRELRVAAVRGSEGAPIVAFEGIASRTDAEQLQGRAVEADRAALPQLAHDEYYLTDFAGLEVVDASGVRLGVVATAANYPANVVLTIRLDAGGELLAPLTHDAVPVVDLAAGRISIDPAFLGIDP